MNSKSYTRKLTTIFSADVVGYSRLMGDDEAATVDTLTTYRKILGELIQQHRGRVVDSPGDNILAEFGSVVEAFQCAQKAISLNDSSIAHALLSWIYTVTRQHEEALEEAERSVALGPNSADAHAWSAHTLICAGEPHRAISLIEKSLRLNPFPPSWYFLLLGAAQRSLAHYEEAIRSLRKAVEIEPTFLAAHLTLAVAYVQDGRDAEARAEAEEVLRLDPNFSLERFARQSHHKDQAECDRIIAALRKAGLK